MCTPGDGVLNYIVVLVFLGNGVLQTHPKLNLKNSRFVCFFNPSFGFLQIFYCNLEANLHVIFEWCNTGWTSREDATADAIITGAKKPKVLGSATPWAEIFEVKVNADSWIYTLQVLYYGKYTFNFVELHSNARIYNDQ